MDGKATERSGAGLAAQRKGPTHAEFNGEAATFAPDLPGQRGASSMCGGCRHRDRKELGAGRSESDKRDTGADPERREGEEGKGKKKIESNPTLHAEAAERHSRDTNPSRTRPNRSTSSAARRSGRFVQSDEGTNLPTHSMGGTRDEFREEKKGGIPGGLLGGDGGGRGGDGEDPDAAGAAARGEWRGEAERDVVEAERHPGSHPGKNRSVAAAAGEYKPSPAAAGRGRDWDVGGGGERERNKRLCSRAISTSGLAVWV